jgi:hypothetical protein
MKRTVIFTYHSSVHLEWLSPRLPSKFHTHNQSVAVFVS